MRELYVHLPNADEVQHFVDSIAALDGDFDFLSNNYILDARSLMGIFTLDISRPLLLRVHQDTPQNLHVIAPFIVYPS